MKKNFKPGQLVRYLHNDSDFTIMVTTDDIPSDDVDSFAGTVVKSVSSKWEVGHHFNRWSNRYFTLVDKVDANTPELDAMQRIQKLMPKSVLTHGMDNLWRFFLDTDSQNRGMSYTDQKKSEDLITFINYTIGRLQDDGLLTRATVGPVTKDKDEPIVEVNSIERRKSLLDYDKSEKVSIDRLKELMPNSLLAINLKTKFHTFYADRAKAYLWEHIYTHQRADEDLEHFIERTIALLYNHKIITKPGDDIAKEDKPNRTHIPKSNITTCPTVSEKLPPIPQPRDLCMPIQIPEGHVRVQLHFRGFEGCIWAVFPARVDRKDGIFINDLIIADGELTATSKTLKAIRDECMYCDDIEWQRDDEGFYQIVILSL